MHVELVRTVTRDGLRLDGAFSDPVKPGLNRSGATAAILLHGVASNFYSLGMWEPLIGKFSDLGIRSLAVNTRGHDSVFGASLGNVRRRLGAAYEIVDDCRLDIAAWIEFLQSRGHERIALVGHSLGAVKAVYAAAQEKFSALAAVIAISPPRLSYTAYMNAPESSFFWDSMHTAQQMSKAGQGEELFTSKFPFPLLITAAAYIDKYGPGERYNLLQYAADVPCPALFVYGGKELTNGGVPFAGLPAALAALPNADRRTIEIIEEADHFYTGVAGKLAEVVTPWVQGIR